MLVQAWPGMLDVLLFASEEERLSYGIFFQNSIKCALESKAGTSKPILADLTIPMDHAAILYWLSSADQQHVQILRKLYERLVKSSEAYSREQQRLKQLASCSDEQHDLQGKTMALHVESPVAVEVEARGVATVDGLAEAATDDVAAMETADAIAVPVGTGVGVDDGVDDGVPLSVLGGNAPAGNKRVAVPRANGEASHKGVQEMARDVVAFLDDDGDGHMSVNEVRSFVARLTGQPFDTITEDHPEVLSLANLSAEEFLARILSSTDHHVIEQFYHTITDGR